MLYGKSKQPFSEELFKNPTSEYRGAPFWAWNCKLEKDELLRQIEIFKQMGLGGYHMHVRTGMATEYLSEEFFDLIKARVEKGNREGMLSYLYDEDRYPSGTAGGFVTQNPDYVAKHILFTATPYSKNKDVNILAISSGESGRTEDGELLAVYDVVLDEQGFLKKYKTINKNDKASGTKWYCYLENFAPSPWFNNQAYIDTLNPDAMDKFIELTYEGYKKAIGENFGKTVHSIFTDEPQVTRKNTLEYAKECTDIILPFTPDFAKTFKKAYGEDIIKDFPQLIWDYKDKPSVIRYHYHDHVCERFVSSFADRCGKWCKQNGIALTGHMMEEDSLYSQTAAMGETMRNYRSFQLPGIDMLCASRNLNTAKQCASAVHQYGREGMLSELYGVTGWGFDFRGHKIHGDWQAALGVTLRVHHLSWVSMKGEAKRDYPASINYQSAWYKKYSYIEDHFARVNTALTRGKPVANVGIIHPVESFWLKWGPNDTNPDRARMNERFYTLPEWLEGGQIDYDYISEALLPDLCKKGSAPLKVGKMEYSTIVVPDCTTLRTTTIQRLEEFKQAGGTLIFMGDTPIYENAVKSKRAKDLIKGAKIIAYTKGDILNALKNTATVEIKDKSGSEIDDLCHSLRQDGKNKWLFVATLKDIPCKYSTTAKYRDIYMNGIYSVKLYNTLNGEITEIPVTYINGKTAIRAQMYDCDSLLLEYIPKESKLKVNTLDKAVVGCQFTDFENAEQIEVQNGVNYTLSELNPLLLDYAEYSFDGGQFNKKEEALLIANKARAHFGMKVLNKESDVAQPWVVEEKPITHSVTLRYTFNSQIKVKEAFLAIEDSDKAEITLNGKKVKAKANGYYIDKSMGKIKLPAIKKGENTLVVTLPFGERSSIEWCYILGNFGVEVKGQHTEITKLPEKLYFGDITHQGLPFYGADITYKLEVESGGGKYILHAPHYEGALLSAKVNDCEQNIVFSPYNAKFSLPKGKCNIDLTWHGTRINTCGPLHFADYANLWLGPDTYRPQEDDKTKEYVLNKAGILSTPIIAKEK